jgi:hypothetical protein
MPGARNSKMNETDGTGDLRKGGLQRRQARDIKQQL